MGYQSNILDRQALPNLAKPFRIAPYVTVTKSDAKHPIPRQNVTRYALCQFVWVRPPAFVFAPRLGLRQQGSALVLRLCEMTQLPIRTQPERLGLSGH
jgi:hypothetical protein